MIRVKNLIPKFGNGDGTVTVTVENQKINCRNLFRFPKIFFVFRETIFYVFYIWKIFGKQNSFSKKINTL